MKKIKIFPAPHVEIRVSVTDEMAADLRECKQMIEAYDRDKIEGCKDCDDCSWRDVEIENTCLCEFNEVRRQLLEEGERWKD